MADLHENLRNLLDVAHTRANSARQSREKAVINGDVPHGAALGGKVAAYREMSVLIENLIHGIDIEPPNVSSISIDSNRRPLARTPRGGMSSSRKTQVRRRGGGYCHYCGDKPSVLEIEHVVPRALGGTVALSNLVTACLTCNDDKGARLWPGHCEICDLAINTWLWRQMRTLWQNWPTELRSA